MEKSPGFAVYFLGNTPQRYKSLPGFAIYRLRGAIYPSGALFCPPGKTDKRMRMYFAHRAKLMSACECILPDGQSEKADGDLYHLAYKHSEVYIAVYAV